jgi:glycosyltransferase involved in cell wall biosynthesis
MLTVSLVTLGDPEQMTGGYLYHRRIADMAHDHGAEVRFASFPADPFPLPARAGTSVLREVGMAGAQVLLLDSIAAAFLAPALAVRRLAIPLVAIAHQPPGGIDHGMARRLLQARLDVAAYRRAERLLLASEVLLADFTAYVPADRLLVVPPGRDVAEPDGPPLDLREGRRAAFLSVGNWVPRKGLLPLLEAFGRLPDDAATLHLVGRDDVDPRYHRQVAARLGGPDLGGRVRVHGPLPRERVARLYRSADAFVLASWREPYGTVYGEAMAAGLPVVGWRAGNLPHLAADGREGLVVAPGDVEALAAALAQLAADEPYRRRLGEAARRRAETFPTWEETAALLFAELRAVAG